MKSLNINNKENQKGYYNLETYGSAFVIEAKWIKIFAVLTCLLTFGTNWLIPILLKRIKDVKIRHENKHVMRLLE